MTTPAAGTLYLPTNYAYMGTDDSVNAGKPFYIRDSNPVFQLKIAEAFRRNRHYHSEDHVQRLRDDRDERSLSNVVYNIAYSGTVTVPQSCEINAGQTILVDFGSLYSGGFNPRRGKAGERQK